MKQSYYFPHDYHARHDPKLEKLRMSIGPVGDGIYWDLVEMLYEQNGFLPIKDISVIAKLINTTDELVTTVVKKSELFIEKDGNFYSESLLERLKHINAKRRKARASAKLSHSANAQRTHSERSAIKESKVKESKVKESKVKESKEEEVVKLVFTSWNERMPWKVRDISGSRLIHLKERLKEPQFINNFHTILTKILDSEFLNGNKPSKGHEGWHADFDWVIKNETNYIKILEDKYANQKEATV